MTDPLNYSCASSGVSDLYMACPTIMLHDWNISGAAEMEHLLCCDGCESIGKVSLLGKSSELSKKTLMMFIAGKIR